jgi:hypothetical protein
VSKPDLDKFRRVIEAGISEAAKECGLAYVALVIDVKELPREGASVGIKVVEVGEEDAETLKLLKDTFARIGIYGGSA